MFYYLYNNLVFLCLVFPQISFDCMGNDHTFLWYLYLWAEYFNCDYATPKWNLIFCMILFNTRIFNCMVLHNFRHCSNTSSEELFLVMEIVVQMLKWNTSDKLKSCKSELFVVFFFFFLCSAILMSCSHRCELNYT